MYHQLLKKQIQDTIGEEVVPTNWQLLFDAISKSYEKWDIERPTYEQIQKSFNGKQAHKNEFSAANKTAQNSTVSKYNGNIEEHLNTTQRMAIAGSWELCFKDGNCSEWYFSFLSVEACQILSLEPGTTISSSAFYERIHPDDKPVFLKTLDIIIQAGGHHTIEYRLILPDGRMRVVRQTAEAFFNKNGTPAKVIGTMQNITAIKQAELELQKAYESSNTSIRELKMTNEELTALNKELDMYVYSVSHDLRAPLSSILGLISHAESETTEEETLQYYTLIKASITKLDLFIKETLADIKNSKKEIRREKICFEELVADVANNLKYMGGERTNVSIKNRIENEATFYSDKNLINTILNNLVSNAIRYSNPNEKAPFVEIIIKTTDEKAHLTIRDNGIGISKENHDKLFGMFYRVATDYAGSGLGLHIVKEAITKLKGTISFESEPEIGTTFNIDIPNMC